MLRITVEMIPHGDESRKRTLASMEIENDGTGDENVGNYKGILYAEYTPTLGRIGFVKGFNRKKNSVWSLVGAFLKLWGHAKHSPKLMSKQERVLDLLAEDDD